MSTSSVIVLGGAGFMGTHLMSALSRQTTLRLVYGDIQRNETLDAEYLRINLLDRASLERVNEYDIIVNCIGQVTKPFNLCNRLNTEGIDNLVKTLEESDSRVLQISSLAVYGTVVRCNEKSPLNPETNYAMVKAKAEFILQQGLDPSRLTLLRLSNLYGPGQNKGIVAYLLRSLRTDRILDFNNDGSLVRSFLHVKDCVRMISEFVQANNLYGAYNLTGADHYSLRELVEHIENSFNVKFDKRFTNVKAWENIKEIDDSRLRQAIGFGAQTKIMDYFTEVLKRSIDD